MTDQSLSQRVADLAARSGYAPHETHLSIFYIGLAIGTTDPAQGRRLLTQLEREMGTAAGESPEMVEVRLRAASSKLAAILEEHEA